MITLDPKHNSLEIALSFGQAVANNNECRCYLYVVTTGDRRSVFSYEFWLEGEAMMLIQYHGRPADYMFELESRS